MRKARASPQQKRRRKATVSRGRALQKRAQPSSALLCVPLATPRLCVIFFLLRWSECRAV